MIKQGTILKVIDNSGAKSVKCIKVMGGFKRRYAVLGDIIVVSVKQLRNRFKIESKVKKGEVYRAIIVNTKIKYKTKAGTTIFLKKNCVTLINRRGNPVGTRILSQIPKTLKGKFSKFISMSTGIS